MQIWELAEMSVTDGDRWLAAATKDQIVAVLMDWHTDAIVDYERAEMIDMILDGMRDGVRGYVEMTEEEVRAELSSEIREMRADVEADHDHSDGIGEATAGGKDDPAGS
jgi:hypothetical protein